MNLDLSQLRHSEIVYGHHCGFGGSEPEYRIQLNHALGLQDHITLLTWLQSNIPALQLYAMEGIYTLKKQGIHFDQSTFQMMELVEKKKGNVQTCSGCFGFTESISKIAKRIKKDYS